MSSASSQSWSAHHNPPAKTVRLTLDNGEVLRPSIYHRFWLCGQGWTMARDLKPGDALRMLQGRVTIAGAQPDEVVPVYNLDVARDHTYFVGEHDYLVHDNTLPGAGTRPFDCADDAWKIVIRRDAYVLCRRIKRPPRGQAATRRSGVD